MTETLKEQINVVVGRREEVQRATALRATAYKDWQEKFKPIIDDETIAKSACQEAEDKLRELTLKAYAETGESTPAPGVGIRERTVLTYDGKVAFDWAKAHKMALQLDKKAFEKIAKADTPDFVKITTEPQATIATELAKVE